MPIMDGQEMLVQLRILEKNAGMRLQDHVLVVMVTMHKDSENVLTAFREQCDGFIVKPANQEKFDKQMKMLELI
jgi:two-component system chemotaxis response regulator CheY